MHKLLKHAQHYLPLFGILSAGLFGFFNFAYDQTFQIVIAIAIALSYVSWGIVHHYIHKDLHASVVVEYVSLAALGVTILTFLALKT